MSKTMTKVVWRSEPLEWVRQPLVGFGAERTYSPVAHVVYSNDGVEWDEEFQLGILSFDTCLECENFIRSFVAVPQLAAGDYVEPTFEERQAALK